MRGKVAKLLRRIVYGEYSPRVRKYSRLVTGQVVAIERRGVYQRAKKRYKNEL